MKLEKAQELREHWGNKHCSHPRIVKEYYLGTQTGDYVCTTCGEAGWGKNWNKKDMVKGDITRYELRGDIGKGSFASVRTYYDKVENKKVAIKFLDNEHKENDDYVDRFKKEISITNALRNHTNVVIIEDVSINDKTKNYWYSMPKATINLDKYIAQNNDKLSDEQRISLFDQVLSAIKYAHDKTILHRDLAPSNILLYQQSESIIVKVADFGLGKDISSESIGANSSVHGYGHVYYTAPEQLFKLKNATNKSDIYSLGKVLYYILTGKTPSNIERCRTFYEVIIRATKDNPIERYDNIGEFISAYEGYKKILLGSSSSTRNLTVRHFLSSNNKVEDINWVDFHHVVLKGKILGHIYDDYIDPITSLFTFKGGDLEKYFAAIGDGTDEFIEMFVKMFNELLGQVGWPFSSLNSLGEFLRTLYDFAINVDVKLMVLKEIWDLAAESNQWSVQSTIVTMLKQNVIPEEIQSDFAFYMLAHRRHVGFLSDVNIESINSIPLENAVRELI